MKAHTTLKARTVKKVGCPKVLHVALLGLFTVSSSAVLSANSNVESALNSKFIANVASAGIQSNSMSLLNSAYAANAKIGKIRVKVDNAGVPADGRSELNVYVTVHDLQGNLMKDPVLLTLEHSGGKLQLNGTADDEFGNTSKDADRSVPGIQLKVLDGQSVFSLIAPDTVQDVQLKVSAGDSFAVGVIPFGLELREMVAAGLIEGSLRLTKVNLGTTISPARIDDGFEREINRFSRSNTGKNGNVSTAALRAAFFLKGKIAGSTLLTLSFDSDKETRARLLRDIKPEQMYPVYGDASVKGFEARSSERFYVRVDKDRSFAMYGDYNTADGFSQAAGTGMVAGTDLRQLGTYSRSLTGFKGHIEGSTGIVNGFVAYDTLKNVTEEITANGTSGPFAVKNTTALENSEKIEILVRDRRNLSTILSITPLVRLNDYVFEPFSSRILLSRALPSLDAQGNPMSLRISYEVDQGGEKFVVAGIDGQMNIGSYATVGGSYVQDNNPIASLKLASVNTAVHLGESTRLVAEIAQSKTLTVNSPVVLPIVQSNASLTEREGIASRVELKHTGDVVEANAYLRRTEAGFMNVSTDSVGAGTQQMGINTTVKLSPSVAIDGDIGRSKALDTDAQASTGRIGIQAKLSDSVTLSTGVRTNREEGTVNGLLTNSACNPQLGSTFSPNNSGGFSGANSSSLMNINGTVCDTMNVSPSNSSIKRQSDTVYVGADLKITNRLSINAKADIGKNSVTDGLGVSVDDNNARRFELGAEYQASERTRVYIRADQQRDLSSQYGLDISNRSSSVSLGINSTYMQGGNVFSEYRLRDAVESSESQIATGLRNAWQLSDGMLLSTGVERLRVISGSGKNAFAGTIGLDYTGSPLWKSSMNLEYRRLDANGVLDTLTRQDTLLFTTQLARKLSSDWTVLARNYYLATNNHGEQANAWQDRFQLGFAYRPVQHNHFDALGKLEYKVEDNVNGENDYRKALVGIVQANYHPSRPWWLSGRLAGKSVSERDQGTPLDRYTAYLLSGRLIYDVTEKIDLGLNLSLMSGKALNQVGRSLQSGVGIEVGYSMASNLWASLGYNFTGYTDKDLSSDYTARGVYLRLRYKFDQDLLQSKNPYINNTLAR
ncbi:MAG: hypothetical protein RL344_1326 [Pseudomonadota bacterium]|jgi:hypothetical protein